MKLYLDTANLADIEEALKGGYIRGITTNPSLLAKEPKTEYLGHIRKILKLISKYGDNQSLSVEVFSNEHKEMVSQGLSFAEELGYKNLAVKIHISYAGQNNLPVIRELSNSGVRVNCTACMTPLQAFLGAAAGAKYVSIFYNRIIDGATPNTLKDKMLADKLAEENDFNPNNVIKETSAFIAEYPKAEIIAGSIRTPLDIKKAALSGAHIVTASPKIIESAMTHFKTEEAVKRFFEDFDVWLK